MRQLAISVNKDRMFRLRGTETWAQHGDTWLCTHDILHHLPWDRGTAAEEAMTFGAELWMGHEAEGMHAISGDNLSGAFADSIKTSDDYAKLTLPEVPINFRRPRAQYIRRFREVAEFGLGELVETLQQRHQDLHDCEMPEDTVQLISGDDNQRRCVDWMAAGYRIAQRRFPDPDRASQLFVDVQSLLHAHGRRRSVLQLELDEACCQVRLAQ